ncbi:MAG: alanine dehydrogenase [Bacillota bacterium]
MIIGVPREVKPDEDRVAVTPAGVKDLTGSGHRVIVESGAGLGSGFADGAFEDAGACIVAREELYAEAEMIMKVKEPIPGEFSVFRPGQVLFTYLHLAREADLTRMLLDKKITAIAYETIQTDSGTLPLLTPMSEVAGRMAVQVGARFLEKPQGGKGILMGGVPGVPAADVVIIGGGTVGLNAAKVALGMGAQVTIIDRSADRLRYIDDIFGNRIKTLMSNSYNIGTSVSYADLVIGAVLVPGAKAPRLVTGEMVKGMKPGSVIVDVAIDQGGSVETMDRVTTHSDPIYIKHGVIHYAVSNMPGAVARTSTFALTNATLPFALEIAGKGYVRAARESRAIARGINTMSGNLTCRPVAESLGLEYTPLEEVLGRP